MTCQTGCASTRYASMCTTDYVIILCVLVVRFLPNKKSTINVFRINVFRSQYCQHLPIRPTTESTNLGEGGRRAEAS